MIVPIHSPLDGIAADRFLSVARFLSRKMTLTDADYRNFLDQEITWCRSQALLNGSRLAYEASVRVLLDLARSNLINFTRNQRRTLRDFAHD